MTPSMPSIASAGGRSVSGVQASQVTVGLVERAASGSRREPDDLVSAGEKGVADRAADQPAGTGDEDSHQAAGEASGASAGPSPFGFSTTVEKVPVSSETRAIPSRRASSTTAAATAGATSRSKTPG